MSAPSEATVSAPLLEEIDVVTFEEPSGLIGQVTFQIKRIRRGDSGLIPIVVGLLALIVYFQIRNSVFLSASNLTNLTIQATVYILLGMAEIWLLLLGEIDLSIGYLAALGGVTGTILVDYQYHWSWFFAPPARRLGDDRRRSDIRPARHSSPAAFLHRHAVGLARLAGRRDLPRRSPRHRRCHICSRVGALRPRRR